MLDSEENENDFRHFLAGHPVLVIFLIAFSS